MVVSDAEIIKIITVTKTMVKLTLGTLMVIAEPLQVCTPAFVFSKTVTQLTHRDRGRLSEQSLRTNADYVLFVRDLIYAAYIFLHTLQKIQIYAHQKKQCSQSTKACLK